MVLRLTAALLVAALLPAASAQAEALDTGDGVPQATCFWFGPMQKSNPATNKAYPELSASYWGARFRVPPGAKLQLAGKYPRARFMSVNAYVDQAAVDSLADTSIKPDKGSKNPYLPRAKRFVKKRSFTVTVPAPGESARDKNVLDAPDVNPGSVQELIYRVYKPDRKSEVSTKNLPEPRLRLANGTVLRGQELCDSINNPQRYFEFRTMPAFLYESLVKTPGADPRTNAAFNPPRWERFFNTGLALSIFRFGTPSEGSRKADLAAGDIGGFYDNLDVKYTVAPINAAFGRVVVLRGKLPTTPRTGKKVRTMGTGQMRYWSICANTSPVETSVIDCVDDATVRQVIDRKRMYTLVVSRKADKPANARASCGVAWLDWGNIPDVLGRQSATLVMRNLGSDPKFRQSLQRVTPADISVTSDGTRSERDILGKYLPRGQYTDTAAFEKRGCQKR